MARPTPVAVVAMLLTAHDSGASFETFDCEGICKVPLRAAYGKAMSEGYTIEDIHGETIGIVVRNERGRGFGFFSSVRAFDGARVRCVGRSDCSKSTRC
jgi:hypothetical protein